MRGEARVAERGERIRGDGNFVALADDNDGGHGAWIPSGSAKGRRNGLRASRGTRNYTRPACRTRGCRLSAPFRAPRAAPHRRPYRSARAASARAAAASRATTPSRLARIPATSAGGSANGDWPRKRQAVEEGRQRLVRQRGSARLLRQFLAGMIDRDRDVQIGRRRQAEEILQQNLARRGRQQVRAAHDVRYLLFAVVDDDRQLIGEQAVAAPDDKVADVAREVLTLRALEAVVARPHLGVDAHAPRMPPAVTDAMAADDRGRSRDRRARRKRPWARRRVRGACTCTR